MKATRINIFKKDSVLLNIIECDLQLYDTYLEQQIVSVKRDYLARHELDIEIKDDMIKVREKYKYLGEE